MKDRNEYRIERHPVEAVQNFGWTICRAPASGGRSLVSLSRDVFGVRTHYWMRRTMPCPAVGCPACLAGREARWAGYLLCRDQSGSGNVVFEFTLSALETFDKAFDRFKSLLGVQFTASRSGGKANGKVLVSIKSQFDGVSLKYTDDDTWAILCRIWGLNTSAQFDFGDPTSEELSYAAADKETLGVRHDARRLGDLPGQTSILGGGDVMGVVPVRDIVNAVVSANGHSK